MAKKLKTIINYLGKQVKESCKIKGDNEITDNAKKETNRYNRSGVCQLMFWIASIIILLYR
jgi:phage host-nuclease inhibitor protein Gam